MIADYTPPRFHQKANCYDKHALIQDEIASWLSQWLPLKRVGRALEAGAGTGLFTQHLTGWNGSVTATDASEEMVAKGREKIPSIKWEPREAHDLGYDELDWIFSSSMLQWMTNPHMVLKHWNKCLKPGGRVLCSVFIDGTLHELNQLIGSSFIPLRWKNEHEWLMIFEKAGLNVLSHQTTIKTLRYPSCHRLLRDLHGIGAVAQTARISTGKLRQIIREYDQRFRRGNDILATFSYMRLVAQKD